MPNPDSYPDPLELMREFVAIPSAFPEEGKMVDAVEERLRAGGFRVRRQEVEPGRHNLLAEKGPGDKPGVLFVGHLDTVPEPETYALLERDPWTVRHDEATRTYRGLGVADMKGGVAAIVAGLSDLEPQTTCLKVALCVDEENLSLGVNKLLTDEREWLEDVRLIISADTGALPFDARDRFPSVLCLMGRLGRITVNATVHGVAGHGAHADPQLSAPMEMARLLLVVDASREALCGRHDFLGRGDISVAGLKASSDSFSTPTSAKVQFNWMALPDDTPETVVYKLNNLVNNAYQTNGLLNRATPVEFEVPRRATPYASGYATPRFGPMVDLVNGAYHEVIGEAPRYVMGRSVGDENFYAEALTTVPLINLGPKGGDLHTADEWVDEDAIPTAARLYREVAKTFDAIGVFKPFWDALPPDAREFVATVVREDGDAGATGEYGWHGLTEALQRAKDPREIGNRVKKSLEQFFPTANDQTPPYGDDGNYVSIRSDLAHAIRMGLDFLEQNTVEAVPVEEAEAIPILDAQPVIEPAVVAEPTPVDVGPEPNPLDARPVETWDASKTGAKVASSGRYRAVSKAPKPPGEGEGDSGSVRVILPDVSATGTANGDDEREEETSNTRSVPRRAPKLPGGDD